MIRVLHQQLVQKCRPTPWHSRDEYGTLDRILPLRVGFLPEIYQLQARFQNISQMHAGEESPEQMQIRLALHTRGQNEQASLDLCIPKIFQASTTTRLIAKGCVFQ